MSYPPPGADQPPPQPNQPYGQPSYGQQPYGQQPYGQGPAFTPPQPQPPMADKAAWSLGLGLLSLCAFGPLSGIPAVVLGVMARRQIRESQGRLGGDGLALGGIVVGVIGTVLWFAVGALIVAVVALGTQASESFQENCRDVTLDGGTGVSCEFS